MVGLVLAAGAGRRMGGPKALIGPLAEFGRTPLAQVCSQVHAAGCTDVIAVIGAQADRVLAALEDDPWPEHDCVAAGLPGWLRVVEATDWDEGMGASLRAGLAALDRTSATAALITLVDLPDVGTPIFRRVLAEASGEPSALARASFDGRPGHPVLIGREHWPDVAASAIGDKGARDYFARTPHQLIECGHLASGIDADTPQDGLH